MRLSILTRLLVLVLFVGLVGVVGLAETESSLMINEVAWAGTQANWADEWIELRNNGKEPVELKGWTLSWGDVTVHLGEEKGDTLSVVNKTIKPGDVFLLERTDDESVSTVKAEVIYKGSLSNSGEKLVLKNSEGSKVHVVDGSDGWVAGTSSSEDPSYASMELINGEWKTNKNKGDQKDAEKNPIFGTPGEITKETE